MLNQNQREDHQLNNQETSDTLKDKITEITNENDHWYGVIFYTDGKELNYFRISHLFPTSAYNHSIQVLLEDIKKDNEATNKISLEPLPQFDIGALSPQKDIQMEKPKNIDYEKFNLEGQ